MTKGLSISKPIVQNKKTPIKDVVFNRGSNFYLISKAAYETTSCFKPCNWLIVPLIICN